MLDKYFAGCVCKTSRYIDVGNGGQDDPLKTPVQFKIFHGFEILEKKNPN